MLVDNFGKYGPISIIISLLQSVMNCGKYGNKSCHLTSNMLPHYLVKVDADLPCLLLFSHIFQSKLDSVLVRFLISYSQSASDLMVNKAHLFLSLALIFMAL